MVENVFFPVLERNRLEHRDWEYYGKASLAKRNEIGSMQSGVEAFADKFVLATGIEPCKKCDGCQRYSMREVYLLDSEHIFFRNLQG